MCSVIGFQGDFNFDLLSKVFDNSRIRGIHSFGYSFYKNEKIVTKKFLDYSKFLQSIHFDSPNKFIAHFRYSTSGDYKILNNNQPLSNEKISIAFNGIISQKTKTEMEKEFNVVIEAENDGFVLMNKINDLDFLSNRSITFAVVGLKSNRLFAMKNSKRPLWISNENQSILIASTNDILKRSGIQKAEELKNLKMYQF